MTPIDAGQGSVAASRFGEETGLAQLSLRRLVALLVVDRAVRRGVLIGRSA
ncbi:MAG: hypothetical protein JW888_17535 [Pirellulales bacterium]|nr:hypothetical protein [Pirellulales bacterium]